MIKRKFTVTNQANEKLVCIEARPNGQERIYPAVLLCHGFDYYKEEDGMFTTIAERLAARGYIAYYFDFSGCGESEGEYRQTSLAKLVLDLDCVYRVITGLDYIDPEQISLIGQSFGTSVCIASQIKNLNRIVLCGSFYSPYELFKEFFQKIDENDLSIRTHSDGSKSIIGPQFWDDLKTHELKDLIKQYHCPILFVHGGKDQLVPVKWMQPLFDACKHPVGPVILKKSDHGLRPEREQLYQAVTDFFDAT